MIYLCELLGIEHGVDLKKLIEIGEYISKELSRENLASVKTADLDLITQRREEIIKILN